MIRCDALLAIVDSSYFQFTQPKTQEPRFLVLKHAHRTTEISLFPSNFFQENEKPVVWDNIGGDRANYSVDNREINAQY
jgi:hypothetical protein